MQNQGEENEALKYKVSEIILQLDRMLEIGSELHHINHSMDSWNGKAKRIFADKYEGVVKELIESLEYSSRLTAVLKQSLDSWIDK